MRVLEATCVRVLGATCEGVGGPVRVLGACEGGGGRLCGCWGPPVRGGGPVRPPVRGGGGRL